MTRGRPVSTHCKEGHELALHAYFGTDGRRRCGLCRRRTWRQAKASSRQRRGPHAAIEESDGGKRMRFNSDAWLSRLRVLREKHDADR